MRNEFSCHFFALAQADFAIQPYSGPSTAINSRHSGFVRTKVAEKLECLLSTCCPVAVNQIRVSAIC